MFVEIAPSLSFSLLCLLVLKGYFFTKIHFYLLAQLLAWLRRMVDYSTRNKQHKLKCSANPFMRSLLKHPNLGNTNYNPTVLLFMFWSFWELTKLHFHPVVKVKSSGFNLPFLSIYWKSLSCFLLHLSFSCCSTDTGRQCREQKALEIYLQIHIPVNNTVALRVM